jgi:putative nucleotidyltransferase with HDIG domain
MHSSLLSSSYPASSPAGADLLPTQLGSILGSLRRLDGYRLQDGELWQHSTATARIAHWLAQSLSFPSPAEAYAAGLLHDMGKPLLDPFVNADYDRIVEAMWKRKLYLWQVEEKLYGIDHAGVGGLMAAHCDLPEALVDAIRYHHAPGQATHQPELAALVNIANDFTPHESLGLSSLSGRMYHPEALRLLGLDAHALERLRPEAVEAFGGPAGKLVYFPEYNDATF